LPATPKWRSSLQRIGGSATADKFATAALNSTARITAIAATALTLDHLPTGWTTDAGTSKTIKVWTGDQIKNGTTQVGQTIERGFLGQGTPNYFVHAGMVVAQANISMALNQPITLANTYQGMSGSVSTSPLDASPDASLVLASFPPFVTRVHVGRVTEAGTTIASPNFLRGMTIVINNNSTMIEAIDAETAQGITGHAVDVTGTAEFYFGNNALLTKYLAGTPTSLSTYAYNSLSGQALIFAIPRVIFAGDAAHVVSPFGARGGNGAFGGSGGADPIVCRDARHDWRRWSPVSTAAVDWNGARGPRPIPLRPIPLRPNPTTADPTTADPTSWLIPVAAADSAGALWWRKMI
jgi:hypothetical protein